jgi:hypothetical protein
VPVAPPLAPSAAPDTSLARLSVLDWIGVVIVGGSALLGLAVPLLVAPMFRRLSASLGGTDGSLAARVLQGWTPALLGMLPLVLVLYAVAVPQPLARRRVVLVVAFALTTAVGAVLLFALYGTLFSLAGAAAGP